MNFAISLKAKITVAPDAVDKFKVKDADIDLYVTQEMTGEEVVAVMNAYAALIPKILDMFEPKPDFNSQFDIRR